MITEKTPVNDGKGLYDNAGLCDTLLVDLNMLQRLLIDNQFVAFSEKIVSMSQRIVNLKKGILEDGESMKAKVEDLKLMNDQLLKELNERDGIKNGNH